MDCLPNCGTHSGRTGPVIGKPAVANVENARNARQFGCGIERPGPPDLSGEINEGFSAAVNFALDRCDAHFPEQLFAGHIKKGLYSRVLQSREAEAALFERAAKAAGERSADGAVAVEENPAAGGATSFRISHF